MERITNLSKKLAQDYITEYSSIYFVKVLCGEASGTVWGDKEDKPDFIMVWSDYQKGFQLMGQPLSESCWDEFYDWFMSIVVSFLKDRKVDFCEYGADSKELLDMMCSIFYDRKMESAKQKMFRHDGRLHKVPMPDGYEYKKIDEKFLQDDYLNKEYILDEIMSSYGSVARYLKEGYGYAAVKDKMAVSRAIMTFGDARGDNIGVDTLEEYRRQGIAAYLVSLVVETGLAMKHNLIWDCTEENAGSEKTALKNGFQQVREEEICWFSIADIEE